MRHILTFVVLTMASFGMLSVPHALVYQHPELVIRAFFRPDLRQDF